MDTASILALGARLRRDLRHPDVLAYIDATLPLIPAKAPSRVATSMECPICAERRKSKAEAMQRYRRKRKTKRRSP